MAALIVVFILLPLAELYVILKVGDLIGIVPTLLLLVADSMLGAWLLKSQGRAVWRRFVEAMQAGRIPGREAVDGGLVIFGGAFLITPGFITDVVGVLLLAPPTRALFRRWLVRRGGRFLGVNVATGRRGRARGAEPPAGWDVEGTAYETDQPTLPR